MNIPLATTKQFRKAVRAVIPKERFYGATFTDRPRIKDAAYNRINPDKRYVKLGAMVTFREIESIEFILWTQGVTAYTRQCPHGRNIRGTCVIHKKEK